jgi:hypothetical protein
MVDDPSDAKSCDYVAKFWEQTQPHATSNDLVWVLSTLSAIGVTLSDTTGLETKSIATPKSQHSPTGGLIYEVRKSIVVFS